MKRFIAIKGTQKNVTKLEVNIDTVYIRTNIERIETEEFTGWQYDEIQYSLREYHELIGNKSDILQLDVNDVAETIANSIEDTISIAELVSFLVEQNATLSARIEQLEKWRYTE